MFDFTMPAAYDVRWYAADGREVSERDGYKYVASRCASMGAVKQGCQKHGLRAVAVKNGRTYSVTASGHRDVTPA